MNNSFELYNVRTHRIGRLVCALCAVMFLGAPFLMGLAVLLGLDREPAGLDWAAALVF